MVLTYIELLLSTWAVPKVLYNFTFTLSHTKKNGSGCPKPLEVRQVNVDFCRLILQVNFHFTFRLATPCLRQILIHLALHKVPCDTRKYCHVIYGSFVISIRYILHSQIPFAHFLR